MGLRATLLAVITVGLLVVGAPVPSGAEPPPGPSPVRSDWAVSVFHLDRSWSVPDLTFDEASATATLERVDGGGVAVRVHDGSGYADLEFAAPRGETLAPGTYVGATRSAFRKGSEPGLDVSAHGVGCNETSGSFDVHRLAADLSAVQISYVMQCDGLAGAVYGEVRVGTDTIPDSARATDASGGRTLLAPYAVHWPDLDPGVSAPRVPVRVVNDARTDLLVSQVDVVGPDADDVDAVHDCDSVAPGGACTVRVAFTPSAVGDREAALVVTTDRGPLRVPLTGRGVGGLTMLRLTTEDGSTSSTPRDAALWAVGTEHGLSFGASPDGQDTSHYYRATVRPPAGAVLRPGTYDITSDPFTTMDRGLIDSSRVGSCAPTGGSLTVVEAAYDDVSGALERLLLTWEQRCWDGPVGGLQGMFAWRARSAAPPPQDAVRWRAGPVSDVVVVPGLGTARIGFRDPPGLGGSSLLEATVRVRPGARPMTSPSDGTPALVERNLANDHRSVLLRGLDPGVDYTVTFFVTPDRTPRPAPTTVVLHGTTTTVLARRTAPGRTRLSGRLTAAGTGLSGRPVRLELRGARGAARTMTTTTGTGGRFVATAAGRVTSVQVVFAGDDRHLGTVTRATVGGKR